MSIIRAPRPARNFQIVEHDMSRDSTISLVARGTLLYLLSHTDGWKTDAIKIAAQSPKEAVEPS